MDNVGDKPVIDTNNQNNKIDSKQLSLEFEDCTRLIK